MAINADSSTPFTCGFDEVNAFVSGGGLKSSFSGVLDIFGISGEAKVAGAIVEAVMIFVVSDETIGRGKNLVMHPEDLRPEEGATRDSSKGVEGPVRAVEPPFEPAEVVIIVRVNDSEPEFFDVDKADGMTEAKAVIKKHCTATQPIEPIRGFDLRSNHKTLLPSSN